MKSILKVALLCTALLSSNAFAIDWSAADALFAKRGEATRNSRTVIEKARTEYLKILNTASNKSDKIRAVWQLGKLAEYEGLMVVDQSDKKAITKIFGDCWCESYSTLSNSCSKPGYVNAISPDAIGEDSTAFHYYRGLCMARWGKVQGTITQMRMIGKLDATIKEVVKHDLDFHGGAANRLGAGVYSNTAVKPLGYYDIEKATDMTSAAMSSADGYDYLENWYGATTVFKTRHAEDANGGWKQKAIDYATEALEMADILIEDGEEPEGMKPEFYYYYGLLKNQYKDLTGGDWEG